MIKIKIKKAKIMLVQTFISFMHPCHTVLKMNIRGPIGPSIRPIDPKPGGLLQVAESIGCGSDYFKNQNQIKFY